jgi:hypothetical protein
MISNWYLLGTIITKNVKSENFKKWNACTSQMKNFSLFRGLQGNYENQCKPLHNQRDLGQTCQMCQTCYMSNQQVWRLVTFDTHNLPFRGSRASDLTFTWHLPSKHNLCMICSVRTDRSGPALGRYLENSNIGLEYHPEYHLKLNIKSCDI